MHLDWKQISGPILTAAMAIAIFLADTERMAIPEPASLFIAAVAFSAALGGSASGLASAVIAIFFTSMFLLLPGFPAFVDSHLTRFITIVMAAPAVAFATGLLHAKYLTAVRRCRKKQAAFERLSDALDEMDIGIVLLDADTRAQFINHAFRRMFLLSDKQAQSKPPFVALMYHGRDSHAYEMPEEELDSYVSKRIAQVRNGNSTPIDLKLANGEILRFRCAALPDGGRMLTYMPITDLMARQPLAHTLRAAE